MTYTIRYTNIPTYGLMYKITVEENTFGKEIDRKFARTRTDRDELISKLKNIYSDSRLIKHLY